MPPPGTTTADAADKPWSASAIVGGTTTGHHVLHVEGYSHTKDKIPSGKFVRSQPFKVGGFSWRIFYYPNGCDSMFADYVSVFLFPGETPIEAVKARAKFTLLDQASKPVSSHTKTTGLNEFSERDTGYGFDKFIKKEFLEASEHLKDDCFKIRCDVTVSMEIHTEDRAATPPFVVVPPSDMHMHFNDLLATEKGADVAFQVAGETFRAHRSILAARSPVFEAELLGAMRESTATGNRIRIDDMLPQVFEALLDFIYTDSLPEMEEQEEAAIAQHLLEAADRYDMPRLKLICEEKLCNHLEVSTAATTLVLAEQHDCQGLKEACIEFLKSPDALEAVMETDGFEHLTRSCHALVKELLSKLAVPLYNRRKLGT